MLLRRLDDLQRRRPVLGFPYAVICKYSDDYGLREAALITYYGFLSLFPILLLGVAVVSRVLASRPELRRELIAAIVPPGLQPGIEASMADLSASRTALIAGLIGLVFSGLGVVLSAYETLNHLAAVPIRRRAGVVSRYLRAAAGLIVILIAAVAAGALTVAGGSGPGLIGEAAVVFAALLVLTRLLLMRRAPMRAVWPAAAIGAVAVTGALSLAAAVLPGMVQRAGRVYGAFAGAAGIFTLLYLLSNVLVIAAEVAAVRHARLWPRALDPARPTEADARAMRLLAREQERLPAARIDYELR
ncbi:YihY/virulence factor BrkB family protein [Actinoplanes sp. NPDC049802]|uniref:YihY/virulence factor BrkB family protein n=1 Tax=Actinoplanes sp. NPDC049802 TaxID=3154742 RepID=UPI0033E00241